MNYRICEKCKKIAYSTGKDYENFIGEIFSVVIIKNIDYRTLEIKGLCPFCNPKSVYYMDENLCYSLGTKCRCDKISYHAGVKCSSPRSEKLIGYWKKRIEFNKTLPEDSTSHTTIPEEYHYLYKTIQ